MTLADLYALITNSNGGSVDIDRRMITMVPSNDKSGWPSFSKDDAFAYIPPEWALSRLMESPTTGRWAAAFERRRNRGEACEGFVQVADMATAPLAICACAVQIAQGWDQPF